MTERKKAEKWQTIHNSQTHREDTGSTEVQIGLIKDRIKYLTFHCNRNSKDFSSIRTLKILSHRLKVLTRYLNRA